MWILDELFRVSISLMFTSLSLPWQYAVFVGLPSRAVHFPTNDSCCNSSPYFVCDRVGRADKSQPFKRQCLVDPARGHIRPQHLIPSQLGSIPAPSIFDSKLQSGSDLVLRTSPHHVI